MSLLSELRRRNVIRMAGLYLVGAWLLVQVAETVLPAFDVPAWVLRAIIIVLALGFIPALVFAWVFELTPEGLKRDKDVTPDASIAAQTGRRMDRLLIAGMVAVVALVAADRYWPREDPGSGSLSPAAVDQSPADAAGESEPDPATATVSDKSIAVLPFENLSSDPDNAYFATGIQDEILTRLSKIGALKVISRTSTMNIASKPANLPEIAAMLGVSTILEGSVQKSGNTVRINVQLIRAATDEHLWAESYDRQLDDVFAVQGEVARAVADALSAALTGAESDALNVAPTTNTKAYEFYLRGLALEARYTNVQEEIAERANAYRKAVELDASFALAWANLSGALTEMYFNERTAARKADARNALDQALSLAPEAAETWSALAIYRYFVERDYDGAFEAYSKALAQRPNDGLIVYSMGNVRRRQGRWDEAVALQQRGTEMDPLATNTWFNYGMTLRALRRFDDAQAAFDRGLAAVPGDPELVIQKLVTFGASGDLAGGNHYVRTLSTDALLDPGIAQAVAFGHLLQRDFPAALAVLEAVLARADPLSERDRIQTQVALAGVQLAMGDREAGLAGMSAVRDRLQSVVDSGNTSPYLLSLLASIYAELGDKATSYRLADEAVEGLRADALGLPGGLETKAFVHMLGGDKAEAIALIRQAQSLPMVYGPTPALLRNDPIWDDLRGEPGFEELTRDGAVPLQTGGPR